MGTFFGRCNNGEGFFTCLTQQYFYRDMSKPLPPMGANPDTITSSGFSSGAYMSSFIHVIMSEKIKGVGLIMGGPYYPKDKEITDQESWKKFHS